MRKELGLLICILLSLIACNSDHDEEQVSENKKYLAKNIVFRNDENPARSANRLSFFGRSAYAQSQEVDTETQILAENVIYEKTAESEIESNNVQDALEEISLDLSKVITGIWDIRNHNQEDVHESTGRIIIHDDGTFDLISGSFAAIGMGSEGMCNHTEENQTYTVYVSEIILFTHHNPISLNDSVENSVIPRLAKLRKNEMVFIGSGGCGMVDRQRISILTRVTE